MTEGRSSNKRIVIFDDSSLMRNLLTGLLDEAGYGDVVAFANLHDGWAYLDDPQAQVNLILMDKALPDGDGIDAIHRIRETPHLCDKPVIMITGFDDRDTLRAAFDAGATDFINKSFDEAELQTRVRSALKLDAALEAFKAREAQLRELTQNLARANIKLENQSLTDGLTGVANRRHFDQALERAWQEASSTGKSLSVALLDVDHFKRYNDHFGHLEGDECLRSVARALSGAVRGGAERPNDLIARYGGEEFAAILIATQDQAAVVAERLRAAVEGLKRPHPLSSVGGIVTISVGVATILPGDAAASVATLCAAADAALYQAKDTGRNRVVGGKREADAFHG
jgi:diguanylate cyclase (GGDEF)-like protein